MNPAMLLSSIMTFNLLLVVSMAHGQPVGDMEAIKNQLIGSYSLEFYHGIDENGHTVRQPYSVGRISYDQVGRMSAQLMPDGGNGGEAGFISYFGTYTIDAERGAVIHHVEGSNIDNLVGLSMPRYFEFSSNGDSLFLETRNVIGLTQTFGSARTSDNKFPIERLTRISADTVEYEFTVQDPKAYADRITGIIPLPRSAGQLHEHACHGGNYGMINILRGARGEGGGESGGVGVVFRF